MPSGYRGRIVCLTEGITETRYLLGADWLVVGISGFTVRLAVARRGGAYPPAHQGLGSPVRSRKASRYLSLVRWMISAGSDGPGARLSQSSVSR